MTAQPTDNRIFVFGSNLAGRHGAGAALFARKQRGAIYGQAHGLQGQSYAIPTLDARFQQRPLGDIAQDVGLFLGFARAHPELRFQVTPIGTGLAGFSHQEMSRLFAGHPSNCDMPTEWAALVKGAPQMIVDEAVTREAALALASYARIKDVDDLILLAFEQGVVEVSYQVRRAAANWMPEGQDRVKFLNLAETVFLRESASIRERRIEASVATHALAKQVYWRRGSSVDTNGVSISDPPE